MTKTAQQIEDDVYRLLSDSSLANTINGSIYKFGTRPQDSTAEDAVVQFISGTDGRIQSGHVTVNIYVPDLTEGVPLRDITRCAAIEMCALDWVHSLPTNEYVFTPEKTIQTIEDKALKQHFVSIQLNYQRFTI